LREGVSSTFRFSDSTLPIRHRCIANDHTPSNVFGCWVLTDNSLLTYAWLCPRLTVARNTTAKLLLEAGHLLKLTCCKFLYVV